MSVPTTQMVPVKFAEVVLDEVRKASRETVVALSEQVRRAGYEEGKADAKLLRVEKRMIAAEKEVEDLRLQIVEWRSKYGAHFEEADRDAKLHLEEVGKLNQEASCLRDAFFEMAEMCRKAIAPNDLPKFDAIIADLSGNRYLDGIDLSFAHDDIDDDTMRHEGCKNEACSLKAVVGKLCPCGGA